MRPFHLSIGVVLCLAYGTVQAPAAEWRRFVIPSTGASADVPVSVFNDETELPDGGIGRRFFTDDRRADLTIQSVVNPDNDFAGHISSEKKSAARYHFQEGDTELLRRVQCPQRSDLVQSLQSGGRIHELHPDQLSARGKTSVGWHRHPNKPHTGEVTRFERQSSRKSHRNLVFFSAFSGHAKVLFQRA